MPAARGLGDDWEDLQRPVERVARWTADNVSSMLVDVRAGRKAKIEEITGVLLRWGRRRPGVVVPPGALPPGAGAKAG